MERHVEWTSPAPFWDQFNGPTTPAQRSVFRTPALLRFASDDFMTQFVNLVQSDAHQMTQFLAVPETWKKPPSEVEVPRPKRGLAGTLERARVAAVRKLEARQGIVRTGVWNAAPQEIPLKLFHPSHQRYYVVTACLVCRKLGLPDRALDTTKQEKVTFVIRMLQPKPGAAEVNPRPEDCGELALVGDEWQPVADPKSFVDGETQYPLTPLNYTEIDGRRRRIFNGLIPVAKREFLVGAKMPNPGGSSTPPPTPVDARLIMLRSQLLGPWAALEDVAKLAKQQTSIVNGSTSQQQTDQANGVQASIDIANDQIQTVSWYLLLDLDEWLGENVHEVWDAITHQSSSGLTGPKLAAYNKLASLSDGAVNLVSALKTIRDERGRLESAKTSYKHTAPSGWPALRFQFVRAVQGDPQGLVGQALRGDVETALVNALDQPLPGTVPAPHALAQVNVTPHRTVWFTVRCVFERPNCPTFSPPVVSDPSAAFQMATFFDPDAPARAIRVAMPADTSPAGLRKFDKNTAFVMSDIMCGQFSGVKGLSFVDLIMSVLPWPLHKDLSIDQSPCAGGGGMVCSFSIPIITICALILLMIIVKLLDIIFFWMPFFQLCLPVPSFDGKKGD